MKPPLLPVAVVIQRDSRAVFVTDNARPPTVQVGGRLGSHVPIVLHGYRPHLSWVGAESVSPDRAYVASHTGSNLTTRIPFPRPSITSLSALLQPVPGIAASARRAPVDRRRTVPPGRNRAEGPCALQQSSLDTSQRCAQDNNQRGIDDVYRAFTLQMREPVRVVR